MPLSTTMTKKGTTNSSDIMLGDKRIHRIYYNGNIVWDSDIWIIRNGVVDETLFNKYFEIINTTWTTLTRSGANFTFRRTYQSLQANPTIVIRNKESKKFWIEIDNLGNYQNTTGRNPLNFALYFRNSATGVQPYVGKSSNSGAWTNDTPAYFTEYVGSSGTDAILSGYKSMTFRIKNLKLVRRQN